MKLVGAGGQKLEHPFYVADGSITAGGTAQLLLAQSQSRSFLMLQNLSAAPLWFEFGSARASVTMTGSAPNQTVASLAVTNAGRGFSFPPVIRFLGGGGAGNSSFLGLGQPGAWGPLRAAAAHCVMTGSAPNQTVASIVVDDPGLGYSCAPMAIMFNSDLDPNGSAVPSAGVGLQLDAQGQAFILNGTVCTTDPIAVFGATTAQKYLCRYMD